MHRILVPLDGSTPLEAVLPLAEALARDYEAELHVPRVSWSVASGKADQAIAQAAGQHCADLITMATHGRGGLARLLLVPLDGSDLSEEVLPVVWGACRSAS